jgi:hypothetical protein
MLLSWAHVPVLFCRAHLSVRHQKRLDPVVVILLADPIRDRHRCVGHFEPLAEGPGEALQQGPGENPEGVVKLLDRLGIQRYLAGFSWCRSGLNGAVDAPLQRGSVDIAGETDGAGRLAGGRCPPGCNGYPAGHCSADMPLIGMCKR